MVMGFVTPGNELLVMYTVLCRMAHRPSNGQVLGVLEVLRQIDEANDMYHCTMKEGPNMQPHFIQTQNHYTHA